MNARVPGIAVVINFDYMNLSCDLCRMFWLMTERAMAAAGFSVDGRVFVSDSGDAIQKARDVMKNLEPAFQSFGISEVEAVREFYCYDLASRVDLNMAEMPVVVELFETPSA